jgi:uncharacterized metal-binding protein YceD (DUF177 family)
MKAPEFSRPLEISRIPAKGSHEHIKADASECAELAKRMDVPAIHQLASRLVIAPWRGGGLKVTGTIDVDLDQISVVSLEAFRSRQSLEVERYFMTGAGEDDDADPIENGVIDLGEITAETLALELDPYPRKPDEAFSGFTTDPENTVSPFAAIKKK